MRLTKTSNKWLPNEYRSHGAGLHVRDIETKRLREARFMKYLIRRPPIEKHLFSRLIGNVEFDWEPVLT